MVGTCATVAKESGLALAAKAAVAVEAVGVGRAIVAAVKAFVNVDASNAVACESALAFARKAADKVFAMRVGIAVVLAAEQTSVGVALVNVDTVAFVIHFKAIVTETLVAAGRVETIGVGVAIVVFEHALVNVETARSVAKEPVLALAFKRPGQVYANRKRIVTGGHALGTFVNVNAVSLRPGESRRAAA